MFARRAFGGVRTAVSRVSLHCNKNSYGAFVPSASLFFSPSRRWASTGAPTHAVSTDNPLKIFYGSQTGTAMMFAEELGMESQGAGIASEVIDLSRFDEGMLQPGTTAVFLAACYGMGEPTDSARGFYDWLVATDKSLEGVDFAVFGLGNGKTHCERFNVVGIEVDKRLGEQGGNRMLDLVKGDDSDCIEVQFDDWQKELLPLLANYKEDGDSAATTSTTTTASKVPQPTVTIDTTTTTRSLSTSSTDFFFNVLQPHVYNENTQLLPITSKKELSPKSDRKTQEIIVSVEPHTQSQGEGKRVTYVTGDHLVVYPPNISTNVDKFISLLKGKDKSVKEFADTEVIVKRITPGSSSVPQNVPVTPREMLTYCIDLQSLPSPKLVRTLSALCADSIQAQTLLSFSEGDTYKREIQQMSRNVLQLVEEFDSITSFPFDLFVSVMPALQPRYYSISTSPVCHEDEVGISFRVLEYDTMMNKHRDGICTHFLSHRVVGDYLPSYIWSSDFKLPTKDTTPVIMVAGGSGIAPFKAFMEENFTMHKESPRPFSLFYGIRDPTEYVYEELIREMHESGAIENLFVSYSLDPPTGEQPKFLNVDIVANGEKMWQQLEQGAYIYVCGGSSGFGPAVSNAFKEVIATHGNMSKAEAQAYFSNVMQQNRYLEDLAD